MERQRVKKVRLRNNMDEKMTNNSYSNMHDMLKDCISEVQANASKMDLPGISSGFSDLDELTCGFEPGKVYVVGAKPAMGKMEFMLSMIRNITLESKVPVLLLSTNHTKSDYLCRLLSIHSGIPTSQFHKGRLKPQEWGKLDIEITMLLNAQLFIHDSWDLPISELVATTRNCIKEEGIKIVFIDCLQMIDFGKADGNSSERVAKVMSALKRLACEVKLPVVVGALLNGDAELREGIEGKRPQLNDLADFSFVEELADVVMMVHRPEYYRIFTDDHGRELRGLIEIFVMKNAFKPLGSVSLNYREDTGLVSNPVRLRHFTTSNKAVKNLIKTFDLKEGK